MFAFEVVLVVVFAVMLAVVFEVVFVVVFVVVFEVVFVVVFLVVFVVVFVLLLTVILVAVVFSLYSETVMYPGETTFKLIVCLLYPKNEYKIDATTITITTNKKKFTNTVTNFANF